MGADILVMQGARASATMIFTMLKHIDSVPALLISFTWGHHTIDFLSGDTTYNILF